MAKILLVDNEANIRFLLSVALNEDNIVLEANDGEEGYKLFLENRPDLIITDLNMPIMGGKEMIRAIRKVDSQVKIIVASALFDQKEERDMILSEGANLCLSKPVTLVEIYRAIEEILK